MLAETGLRLNAIDHRFEFIHADAQSLPVLDSSLDAVIANHMLYHVPNRQQAYREICRGLSTGGQLYAATNGLDHLYELEELRRQVGIDTSADESNFTLDNGSDELSAWFAKVELRRYEDQLRVTEAEPIIDYIRSMPAALTLKQAHYDAIAATVARRIAEHGAFYITKSAGMFIASEPLPERVD
jgi:ubiquinone/menaquinone biosynthesis C-methylase UbiE